MSGLCSRGWDSRLMRCLIGGWMLGSFDRLPFSELEGEGKNCSLLDLLSGLMSAVDGERSSSCMEICLLGCWWRRLLENNSFFLF